MAVAGLVVLISLLTTLAGKVMRSVVFVHLRVVHGLFCMTGSNPIHHLTDPTQPNPLQVKKLDPTQYKLMLMSVSGFKPVPGLKWVKAAELNRKLRTQVSNTSKSASLWSYCHFITPSDRFPVPVRSAEKSNLTAWCNQILSNCAWNALT